ncbi:MAG: methionyl-tRNA formyltransferase [Bacteroidota bacterium]|nr:methionyl-tRNA formyltransferase [Bacteroidota bacterium]
MKIVFMGTPDFAIPSLEILLNNRYDIAAVVTAPDKPRGRGQQVSFTAVKECALKHSLQIFQPDSLKGENFISQISNLGPDLFVVVAFRILPKEVFSIPTKGAFNLHASLLPQYRGAAPINWAIINGEKESGVTTFFLQEKVDTGNILLQARVAIGEATTAGELHDVLADVGAEIVLQTVRLIELGKANPRSQNETLASPAPKIFKDDCRIQWEKSSREIHNFIRGLSPYPTAWTTHEGKQLKIYRSEIVTLRHQTIKPQKDFQPGKVTVDSSRLYTGTGDGAIEILQLQQEGKKKMATAEFLRGYRFNAGAVFN